MEQPYNQTNSDIPVFEDSNMALFENNTELTQKEQVALTVAAVVFFVALPGICFAVYKLSCQVKPDQVAPVYVINLLISDLIQISANPISYFKFPPTIDFINHIMWVTYMFGLHVNVCFMVIIFADRYIMIAHAFWYVNVQNIRTSVIVSVTAWIFSAVVAIITFVCRLDNWLPPLFLLVPYPLVMFFLVGTWRALSRSSVPRNDQRRVMGILVLVFFIYTIFFLPYIILSIRTDDPNWIQWAEFLIMLNPLFDCLLYVLMRRDVQDILRTLFFCFSNRHQETVTVSTNVTV